MEWSGPELILLFVIALVVLGPERMAQVAKKLGQFVGYARRMSRNLQVQLEDELEMKQIRESLPKRVDLRKELGIDELEKDVKKLNEPALPPEQKTGKAAVADEAASADVADAETAQPPKPADPAMEDIEHIVAAEADDAVDLAPEMSAGAAQSKSGSGKA